MFLVTLIEKNLLFIHKNLSLFLTNKNLFDGWSLRDMWYFTFSYQWQIQLHISGGQKDVNTEDNGSKCLILSLTMQIETHEQQGLNELLGNY